MSTITPRSVPDRFTTLKDRLSAQRALLDLKKVLNLSHDVSPELANTILDYAYYWPKVASNGPGTVVSACKEDELNSAEVLLLTPTMEELMGPGDFKIRAVRFKLESHDQGWATFGDSPSRYFPSWTWFEAVIVRDPRYNTSSPETDAFVKEALAKSRRGREAKSSVTTVRNPHAAAGLGEDTWDIQRNVRASEVFVSHEVRFKEDNEDVASGRIPGRVGSDGMTGAGSGDGFIGALEKGDRIAVVARARQDYWENHVRKIELEVDSDECDVKL